MCFISYMDEPSLVPSLNLMPISDKKAITCDSNTMPLYDIMDQDEVKITGW